jgi:hypothetical protein
VECNFDVVDAVKKLEKLGIVSRVRLSNSWSAESSFVAKTIIYFSASFFPHRKYSTILHVPELISNLLILSLNLCQDSIGRIICVPLKRANEIIGTTTEEMVMRAQQAPAGP